MITASRARDQLCVGILQGLQLAQQSVWQTIEQRTAVIQLAGNKRRSCGSCSLHRHQLDERGEIV